MPLVQSKTSAGGDVGEGPSLVIMITQEHEMRERKDRMSMASKPCP